MPEQEEVEIILTPDGKVIVGACIACALGAKDDRCGAAVTEIVRDMVKSGEVTKISEPEEVPH